MRMIWVGLGLCIRSGWVGCCGGGGGSGWVDDGDEVYNNMQPYDQCNHF